MEGLSPIVLQDTCFLVAQDAGKRCVALAEQCYAVAQRRGPGRRAGQYWLSRAKHWLGEANRWLTLAEEAARGA